MSTIAWASNSSLPPAPAIADMITPIPRQTQEPTGEIKIPNINTEILWQHLETLQGERYHERDREISRNYITENLKQWGYQPILQAFEGGINIIVERPGINPKAGKITVGAHYDTVLQSPGVDDNGTGIATLLELARLYHKKPTPNTLQLIFFDREEKGLLGSLAFTSKGKSLQDLKAVIILDMIGHACRTPGCQQYPEGISARDYLKAAGVTSPDQGEFLAVVGETDAVSLFKSFSQLKSSSLPPVVTVPIPLKGLLTPDVLRSDHAPFWYHNIPAVLVTDTANLRSRHYHQPTDTLENIDRSFFEGSAQIVVNATSQLLNNR
jgi:Zn-dependent M28 family amino/carboxypeptidase